MQLWKIEHESPKPKLSPLLLARRGQVFRPSHRGPQVSIGSRLLAIHEAALPTGRTDLQPQTNLTILDRPLPSAGKPCPASTRTY